MVGLPEYLRGAADLHVYSAPDVAPRLFNDIGLAREMERAGAGALLLRSDTEPTMGRAYLTRQVVPGVVTRGGIVLNDTVGGFNVAAVRAALERGASEVSMPTLSAHQHKVREGHHGGLSVLDAHGELRHDVKEIVILMAHSRAFLSTGHLGAEEGATLLRYAYAQGLRRLVVTHPEWSFTAYPMALQRDLAGYGVQFVRCFGSAGGVGEMAEAIRAVGVETTVVASGLGEPGRPGPVEGLAACAAGLRAAGFTEEELRRMMVTNPSHLLE